MHCSQIYIFFMEFRRGNITLTFCCCLPMCLPMLLFFNYYCSVMQSDGNSFFGDVVLDSFKKTSRDEDEILDQIYKSKYVRITIIVLGKDRLNVF